MPEQCIKSGYTGYDGMGKPIPHIHRVAACETCKQYGYNEKTAKGIVAKMVRLLERNNPHGALLSARNMKMGFTITRVYHLIYVLMTGEK